MPLTAADSFCRVMAASSYYRESCCTWVGVFDNMAAAAELWLLLLDAVASYCLLCVVALAGYAV